MDETSKALFLLGLIALGAACRTQAKRATSADPGAREAAGAGGDQEASLRGKDFAEIGELSVVYFAYDDSRLDETARETLKRNAAWLKDLPKSEIQVEGHCDDRGTIQYNIALGQRRAQAVRDYYKAIGVPMNRMSTISYGKEKPACKDATEECWQANRRGVTLLRRSGPGAVDKK